MRKSLRRKDMDEKTINVIVQQQMQEYYKEKAEEPRPTNGVYHTTMANLQGQESINMTKGEHTATEDYGTALMLSDTPIYLSNAERAKLEKFIDGERILSLDELSQDKKWNNTLNGSPVSHIQLKTKAGLSETYGGNVIEDDYTRTKQERE